MPGPACLVKYDGGTSLVCTALWTAVHARPSILYDQIVDVREENRQTFCDLARQAKFKAVGKMNERVYEACKESVKHLRMLFPFIRRSFYFFYIAGGKILVEVVRR
jgi:hypothetical protein